MIVLDTRSWIWWLSDPLLLSSAAQRALGEVSERNPVLVSSISVWELYILVEKGRLALKTDPAHWVHQCELSRKIKFVPLDNEIARISTQLPKGVPADPADRMIVATALALGARLITKDSKIRASRAVQTVW